MTPDSVSAYVIVLPVLLSAIAAFAAICARTRFSSGSLREVVDWLAAGLLFQTANVLINSLHFSGLSPESEDIFLALRAILVALGSIAFLVLAWKLIKLGNTFGFSKRVKKAGTT
jgi:hypothetical protein